MGYKDWLEILLKILSRDTTKTILQGTNKKKYWTVEAHENRKIIISKDRQIILRNIEFLFRTFFTGVVFVALNYLLLFNGTKAIIMNLGRLPYTFTDSETKLIAMPWLVIMYIASGSHHYMSFEEGLIGTDSSSKKVKQFEIILITLTLCSCILNCLLFWCDMAPIYLFLYGCYSAVILFYFIGQCIYLSKCTIYSFRARSVYNNPDPKLVRLDQDISIQLKQGRELQINFLKNNLYICDSDDILISPDNKSPYIIHKESIKYLKIKDVQIIFDGTKWKRLESTVVANL